MPVNVNLPKEEETEAGVPGVGSQTANGQVSGEIDNRLIKSVTFFGDSAILEDDEIYKNVWSAAKLLAQNNYAIVNGGGPGVMKAATDGAESVNGKTVAVYWQPKLASFFEGKNLANVTDESETFSNYLQRTLGLIEKGDAYVVCKGGTGTISEFGMVWALAKLYYGCHKPVILFGDFWDDLIEAFQKGMILDETELGVLYQATTGDQILEILKKHELKIQHCRVKNYNGDEAGFLLAPEIKATIKAYDQNGQSYHAEHAGKLVSQVQLEDFISMVNPPAKVLDIGTGPGFDAKFLSSKYNVTGIEPSKRFFEIASYECPNVEMIQGDVVKMDMGSGIYKGIWARDSIHHIKNEDLDGVFTKVANALVEGGVFYVIVREGEGEFVEKEKKSYGHLERFYHLFTAEELIDRAKRAGLELVKIDRVKRSHNWLVGVFKK